VERSNTKGKHENPSFDGDFSYPAWGYRRVGRKQGRKKGGETEAKAIKSPNFRENLEQQDYWGGPCALRGKKGGTVSGEKAGSRRKNCSTGEACTGMRFVPKKSSGCIKKVK